MQYRQSTVLTSQERDILSNPTRSANQYGEGDNALEQLLLVCYQYGLLTEGCCKGHDDDRDAYISFLLDEKNELLMQYLFTELSNHPLFTVGFSNGNVRTDRLIFFIRGLGLHINWKVVETLIQSFYHLKQDPVISNTCHTAYQVVSSYFRYSSVTLVYTELSIDQQLYLYFQNTALTEHLGIQQQIPSKPIPVGATLLKSIAGRKGFVFSSVELEKAYDSVATNQAGKILDVFGTTPISHFPIHHEQKYFS